MHLIILLMLFFSLPINAKVTASVDQHNIKFTQNLQLKISSDNAAGKTPNLTGLKQKFKVIGSSKISRPYIRNGQRKFNTIWFYILKPKISGKLTIPAISINGEKTKVINLWVSQGQKKKRSPTKRTTVKKLPNTHNIIIKASLNKTQLYPNEILIYELSINTPENFTTKLRVIPPFVPNAIILPLTEASFEKGKIRGKNRNIRRQSFAIFTSQVAIHQIEPAQVSFKSSPSDQEALKTRLKANNLHFEIIPKANQTSLGYWLPSQSVQLMQQWKIPNTLRQGDVIHRTLTLKATGLDADSLPLMSTLTHQDIGVSLEEVTVENRFENGQIIAFRSETVAMTFNTIGTISIEPIDIHWWNTQLNQARVATIEAQSFTVIGKIEPIISPQTANSADNTLEKTLEDLPKIIPRDTTSANKLLSDEQLNGLIVLLFILLVATTAGWLTSLRKKR